MVKRRKPRWNPGAESQGDPRLSPEVDLLECLHAMDQTLDQARLPFATLEHAQRAVIALIKVGSVELFRDSAESGTKIPDWQVVEALNNAEHWKVDAEPRFELRMTDKGYDQFEHDSASFFDELFGRNG